MSDWNPALYMQYGAERSRPPLNCWPEFNLSMSLPWLIWDAAPVTVRRYSKAAGLERVLPV